jgi:rhodanese-related sulfurtransferase/GNAT superfamily N-acetyltransferase
MEVRPLAPADAAACDAIIGALPDWFGDDEGIRACAQAVRTQPGFATIEGGAVVGFLTVIRPRPRVAEISWMAVHPDHRGTGGGRALLDALVVDVHPQGIRFLVVKTLSDREPYEPYAQTRAFYEAMGFTPLMDLDLWGPENPALVYIRTIAAPVLRELDLPAPTVEDLLVASRRGGTRVSAAQAYDELAAGAAIVVDQRTLEQRRQHGDIPGATTLSMTVVPWRLDPASPWKLPAIRDHDARVIVVCQEGYSSSLSAAWLRDLGMRNVADVEGGFDAWRDAGLPIVALTET